MERKRDPRGQGDLGERSAMLWFGARGAAVFMPCFHCSDFDIVVDWGDGTGLIRVQVKTSACVQDRRWKVAVCTHGGNQSWNGLVKRLDPTRYDQLFVLVGDGRPWLIPSEVVEGGRAILLGGPKYAEFEIEPGDPLPAYTTALEMAPQR